MNKEALFREEAWNLVPTFGGPIKIDIEQNDEQLLTQAKLRFLVEETNTDKRKGQDRQKRQG